MGIKLFVTSIFLLSLGFYFVPVSNNTDKKDEKDIPLIVFEKPKMYTLNEKDLTKVVLSQKAIKYRNRDVMINGNITLKNQNKDENFLLENIKANRIISHGDILTFDGDVDYRRDGFVQLETQKLYYNTKDKIAYNDVKYEGKYYDSYVNGTSLYVDSENGKIKSKNSHFEIDIENK